VDLILIGSHSPRSRGHPVLGSTSNKVAIAAGRSVLIVKPGPVVQEGSDDSNDKAV